MMCLHYNLVWRKDSDSRITSDISFVIFLSFILALVCISDLFIEDIITSCALFSNHKTFGLSLSAWGDAVKLKLLCLHYSGVLVDNNGLEIHLIGVCPLQFKYFWFVNYFLSFFLRSKTLVHGACVALILSIDERQWPQKINTCSIHTDTHRHTLYLWAQCHTPHHVCLG